MNKGKKIYVLMTFFFMLNLIACFKNDTRETTTVITGACSGTPGPLFSAVKNLVASKCVSCHNTVIANGGKDFSIECNIVTSQARIKVRAVDEGSMPQTGPLSSSDRAIITAWINAGGKYTD